MTNENMTHTMAVTAPNGDTWTVPYRRSIQRGRVKLGGNANGGDASRYTTGLMAVQGNGTDVECTACGAVLGLGRGTAVTLADGRSSYLPAAEADRAIADLDGWTFSGPAVPYCPSTVLPMCPAHNGDSGKRAALTLDERARVDAAARALLDRHATRA